MTNPIATHFATARKAQGDVQFFNENGDLRGIHKKQAASVGHHSIRTMEVPFLTDGPLNHFQSPIPTGIAVAKKTTLETALMASSNCILAGANMIVIPTADEGKTTNGELYFQKRSVKFHHIAPAKFIHYPDHANMGFGDGPLLDFSPVPLVTEDVDMDNIALYGFGVDMTRRDILAYGEGVLTDCVMTSIAMGLGKAVDDSLLTPIAIGAEAFSLPNVAAAGLQWEALTAMVGTEGTGATVGVDGVVRAAGVPALLTDVSAETIIGAWANCAVAVSEDITLVARRSKKAGGMELTCWASIQPMLPVRHFWKVAA